MPDLGWWIFQAAHSQARFRRELGATLKPGPPSTVCLRCPRVVPQHLFPRHLPAIVSLFHEHERTGARLAPTSRCTRLWGPVCLRLTRNCKRTLPKSPGMDALPSILDTSQGTRRRNSCHKRIKSCPRIGRLIANGVRQKVQKATPEEGKGPKCSKPLDVRCM